MFFVIKKKRNDEMDGHALSVILSVIKYNGNKFPHKAKYNKEKFLSKTQHSTLKKSKLIAVTGEITLYYLYINFS